MTEQSSHRQPGAIIRSPKELDYWLSIGVKCWAVWRQDNCQFKTMPGLVVAVKDDIVLIEHWGNVWMCFNDPAFEIQQGF